MKNSNETIGSRTRDLPACSAVLQPTAPPRALSSDNVSYVSVMCLCTGYPVFNPLNAKLNPIYTSLALFGAHHILHVSR